MPPAPARPPPPSVARQVAEIAAEPDRAAAYARLLHLQRACADDPSSAADLAAASPSTLLPLLLRDAAHHDEAVAASALKCLGFALYHPVLVSTISGQMAQLVLDTLGQLIMTTRMKAICNLGVWCISVQQLEVLITEDRLATLLAAIVYALDNPFGSLSTTFEAAQAIMKLASQNPERMRNLSSIWVPPIYRRLFGADKTERDMAGRCLVKVLPVVLPPQPLLSEVVASVLDQSLLSHMMNMLDDPSKKVQAVTSWGWSISLLGSIVVSNKPLLNKILKVPELMFIDPDPQVQIATVVAWKKIVDVFFARQDSENIDQETIISAVEARAHTSAHLKRIKLIMMPLCKVLSRSHNIALSSSCLSTWNHLLCKLGGLINHSSILEVAFGPVLKIIFSIGLDNQNKPLWSFCINLFHDFISVKVRHMALPGDYLCGPSQSCVHLKALLDVQHIKWLPWDATCFDFQLEILESIVNPGVLQNMSVEIGETLMNSATQIFRLFLQGVQVDCKANLAHDNAQICITEVCKFVKRAFLDLVEKQDGNNCAVLVQFGLQFVKFIVEELDHSLLASGKYELCLDIEQIKEMQYAECSPKLCYPGIRSLPYMEMVSPAVYLTTLSLSMVVQFTGELSRADVEQLASILYSSDSVENLYAVVALLYMQIMCPLDGRLRIKWLMVWNIVAKRLSEHIISYLKLICGPSGHDVLYQFFCYPFFALLSPGRISTLRNAENSSEHIPVTQDLEVERTIEVYRSLCTNSTCRSEDAYKVFLDHFCEYLVTIIDENTSQLQANFQLCSEKFINIGILSNLGEVVIGLIENARILNCANQESTRASEESVGCRSPNLFLSCLNLVNRFMKLSIFSFRANPAARHEVTSRFFSSLSTFIGHLTLKKDILLLFEIIGNQLTEWLSLSGTLYCEMRQGETIGQLEKLWLKTVRCLTASQLINDDPFLQKLHPLFQAAVSHPHKPISAATTPMWRASRSANTSRQHSGLSVGKLDGLPVDRRKDLNSANDADRAITLQELEISRMFTSPNSEKRIMTPNSTEHAERNSDSLRISGDLERKKMKIMKYPSKDKGLGKNTADFLPPHLVENKMCRKPELILEMLKRKR